MFSNKSKLSFKHSYFRVNDFTSRSVKIIVVIFFKISHILLYVAKGSLVYFSGPSMSSKVNQDLYFDRI